MPKQAKFSLKCANKCFEGWSQGRIKRGAQGELAPGPPSSKGPPATEKKNNKSIITFFNNANVIKVRLIWLLSAS